MLGADRTLWGLLALGVGEKQQSPTQVHWGGAAPAEAGGEEPPHPHPKPQELAVVLPAGLVA